MAPQDRPTSKTPFAHGLMLICAVLVATSFPVVVTVIEVLPSIVLTFLRFGIATLVMLPFVAIRHGASALPSLRTLAGYGVLSAPLVAFFYIAFEALHTTSALNTGALFSLSPSFAALFAFVLLNERQGPVRLAALATGVVGAVWVVFRGDLARLMAVDFAFGDALFIGGVALLGLYSVLVKRLGAGRPVAVTMFWTLATGTLWLSLLGHRELAAVQWAAIPGFTLLTLTYLAVFTTLLTFAMSQAGIGVLGPTRAMAYNYLNPGLVALLIWALGGDAIGWATVPGIALTLTSMVVLQTSPTKPTNIKLTAVPLHS